MAGKQVESKVVAATHHEARPALAWPRPLTGHLGGLAAEPGQMKCDLGLHFFRRKSQAHGFDKRPRYYRVETSCMLRLESRVSAGSGDKRPTSRPGYQNALCHKGPVGPGNRVGMDAEHSGQCADRGQSMARCHEAPCDRELDLCLDLTVHWYRIGRVQCEPTG